jgi:hypothetical protein
LDDLPDDEEGDIQAAQHDDITQSAANTADVEMPDGVEQLTPDDVRIFLENESIAAAQRSSQEGVGHHVPQMNMTFDTDDAAYNFYNEYAAITGFSIKKAGVYNGKKVQARTYTCNHRGKVVDQEILEERKKKKQEKRAEREGKPIPQKERARKTNVIQVTGCEAKLVVTMKGDKWFVTKVELQHNHDLCSHDDSRFLRSHKHMTTEEKLFIRTFTSVKLATRKIMAILTYLRGGKPKNVPYTKKGCQQCHDINQERK